MARGGAASRGRLAWKLAVAALIAMVVLLPLLLGLILVHALLGLLLVAGLFGAQSSFRQARLFADTPQSTIRAATQGHVELVAMGAATDRDGRPVRGPLSNLPCCYWTLEAERRIRSGRSNRWQSLGVARSAPWLPLNDGTGTCLVAIGDATLHTGDSLRREADAALRMAVAERFPPSLRKRLAQPGRWRLREVRLPADTQLYAMGRFESRRSNAPPEAAGAVTKGPDAAASWQAMMRRLEGVAPGAPLGGIALAHCLVPDRRDGQALPLIVSARPQRWLVRRYRLYTLACASLAAAAAGGWLLLLAGQHPAVLASLLLWLGIG